MIYNIYRIINYNHAKKLPYSGSATSPPTSAADPPSGAHACRKGGTISRPSKSRLKKMEKIATF